MKVSDRFWHWLDGDIELYDDLPPASCEPDEPREVLKARRKDIEERIDAAPQARRVAVVGE